jgi:tRNA-2-methylthio-N6-dimethylallyladenosine synthase
MLSTYAVYAIGCQQNWYDAEKVAHALDSAGLFPASTDEAELIIILACSVRQKAVDRIFGLIDKWRNKKAQQIIVSACVLPADQARVAAKADALVKEADLMAHLSKLIGKSLTGEIGSHRNGTNTQHPSQHAFIPITLGCNNFCTFCAVPHTRGREQSRPKTLVLAEAGAALHRGATHLTLLGQNVNSYGLSDFTPRDLRKNRDKSGRAWTSEHPSPFVELLRDLEKLPGLKSLAFLSPNPQDISDDLIEWMGQSTVFSRTLNLPLQSGSDTVLKRMNRRYSIAEYQELVRRLRLAVPDLLLSSDIIVGFPGETDEDFAATMRVARESDYVKVFTGIYSPRPGTVSAQLYEDDVPATTKHARWAEIEDAFNKQKTALNPATGDRLP